jgi:glycerol transport system ATP-binding protein
LEIAGRLGIEPVLECRPVDLTLVQKQLTAIGKALVRPDVSLVLLDEPLTAAQPEHKWQLRQTLKSLQADLGATMIYVTHDQTEALTFADRVSVLHDGIILQTATPQTLIEQPDHEHVGYFVGSPGMNLIDAVIREGACWVGSVKLASVGAADGPCRVGFRPEWAEISHRPTDPARAHRVLIQGMRTLTTHRHQAEGLAVAMIGGNEITTRQTLSGLKSGDAWLTLDPDRVLCFRDGRRVMRNA